MVDENSTITLEWFEVIVVLTSLLESVDAITAALGTEDKDEDETYELEERLNDYRLLITKLKVKYSALSDKGELPETLRKRLREIG